MDALELHFPVSNLSVNCLPFFVANFTHHVGFNDNLFVKLVNFRIDNSSLDCFNGPLLYVVLVDLQKHQNYCANYTYIEKVGKFLILEIG